jgi:hypothetical protein
MSEGYQRDRAGNGNAGQARNTFPALTLSSIWALYFPAHYRRMPRHRRCSVRLQASGKRFLGHRIQEDLALIQRVTHSATPDQILAAYSEFWQKAAEDYRKEFAAVTKLLTKMPRKAAAVSQTATGETSANAFLSQNAA